MLYWVWAGLELAFHIAAYTVLCFVLVARAVLINPPKPWLPLSSTRTAPRPSLQHPATGQWAGDGQKVGRGHSQDSGSKLTKGILRTMPCSAIKAMRKKKGRVGHLLSRGWAFKATATHN